MQYKEDVKRGSSRLMHPAMDFLTPTLTCLAAMTILVRLAAGSPVECLPEPEMYDAAVARVCADEGPYCPVLAAKGRDHFYECLNGNQGRDGDEGSCLVFARAILSEDPRLDHVTHDIVLWSGLSPAQQSTFKVLKVSGDGSRVPLLLGTTIGSKVVAAMNTFDWDNEADCNAKTSASANSCVQGLSLIHI